MNHITELQYFVLPVGLEFNLSSVSDLAEASIRGYNNNYIDVYSNSWGPSDYGFVVSGPGQLTKQTLANGVAQVRGIPAWEGG